MIEEARSAKSPGRPVFNEMLKRIERGEADGILAWHPDRLARNALDGGQIIHFLDTGKLMNLRFPTYTFENSSQGKFMLAIMFGQSKYYVDSLSENVRRGTVPSGELQLAPGQAPIGYMNARSEAGEKIIVPDPERFELLRRLWELLLSGGYSVPELNAIAADQLGLRTPKKKRRGGSPLSVSGLYRVLSNPFYAGQIRYKGQWYPGRHETMITGRSVRKGTGSSLAGTTFPAPKSTVFAFTGSDAVRYMPRMHHRRGKGKPARQPLCVLPLHPQETRYGVPREVHRGRANFNGNSPRSLRVSILSAAKSIRLLPSLNRSERRSRSPVPQSRMPLSTPLRLRSGTQTI